MAGVPPPLPEPDRDPLGPKRSFRDIQEENLRQDYRDYQERERAEAGQRVRERAASGPGIAGVAATALAGLGLGSIVSLHEVAATVLGEPLGQLADAIPTSWPGTGPKGVAVQFVVGFAVATPLWLAAWGIRHVRTAVGQRLSGGMALRLLRWIWLTAATVVRAILRVGALALGWVTFSALSQGFVEPAFVSMEAEGVLLALLLVLPASMARAFFLGRELG